MSIPKKTVLVLLLSLALAATVCLLLLNWVVPKMALFTTPQKWRMLPLRESKPTVRDYLGQPSQSAAGFDEWVAGSKGKTYGLRIFYTGDTLAVGYVIHYHYQTSLVNRHYVLDSFSIR